MPVTSISPATLLTAQSESGVVMAQRYVLLEIEQLFGEKVIEDYRRVMETTPSPNPKIHCPGECSSPAMVRVVSGGWKFTTDPTDAPARALWICQNCDGRFVWVKETSKFYWSGSNALAGVCE